MGVVGGSCASSKGPATTGTTVSPTTKPGEPSGAQLWVARYNGSANRAESISSVNLAKASPDGSRLFVTGSSEAAPGRSEYVTIAYDSATGTRLWAARYGGPAGTDSIATALALSPDGAKVFVTGSDDGGATGYDLATVAYDANTGNQLWIARYNGPANRNDGAAAIAVDPRGDRVFITGTSEGTGGDNKSYATVAYNASTGAQLWATRYDGVANRNATYALAVRPDGGTVYVTGWSQLAVGHQLRGYGTVAYNAATGAQLWVATYQPAGAYDNEGRSLAVSPDGAKVFVTGASSGESLGYGTVGYNAATGAQLWAQTYAAPPQTGPTLTSSLVLSPDGTKAFVTGIGATAAYNAATGARLWAKADTGIAAAVSGDGSKVFVTGTVGLEGAGDYATTAYSAAGGGELWAAQYDGPAKASDTAASITVSPTTGTVFVTGTSEGTRSGQDLVTVAYRG